eukprot:13624999-Heterocapsa_arctica.AAC.1
MMPLRNGEITNAPPPCGGSTQNILTNSKAPLTAAPAISLDKTYTLSNGDLSVLTSIIQGIPH